MAFMRITGDCYCGPGLWHSTCSLYTCHSLSWVVTWRWYHTHTHRMWPPVWHCMLSQRALRGGCCNIERHAHIEWDHDGKCKQQNINATIWLECIVVESKITRSNTCKINRGPWTLLTSQVVLETVVEYGHSRRNISKLNRKWLVFAISKLGAKNNAEVKSIVHEFVIFH